MTDKSTDVFRSSIRTVLEMAPPAPEMPTAPSRRPSLLRPTMAFASGFAIVLVVGLSVLGLPTTTSVPPPTDQVGAATSAVATTMLPEAVPTVALPNMPQDVASIRDGGLIAEFVGIRSHEIVTSDDNGATWTTFYSPADEINAIDVRADGTILAVGGDPESVRGAISSESWSNSTPRVHSYSHETGHWTVATLPRPEFDSAGVRDDWSRCELMGVEDFVTARSVASGPTAVILGGHAMANRGSCSGGPFLWTSTDGRDWKMEEQPPDLHLSGIAWDGAIFIGYGSAEPWYDLTIWESADLNAWTPARLSPDAAAYLADTRIAYNMNGPDGEPGGIKYAGPVPLAGGIALAFPVQELVVQIPDDLETIEDLRAAIGADPTLGGSIELVLETLGVTLPPTAEELVVLRSYYEAESTTIGRVVLSRSTDGIWTISDDTQL